MTSFGVLLHVLAKKSLAIYFSEKCVNVSDFVLTCIFLYLELSVTVNSSDAINHDVLAVQNGIIFLCGFFFHVLLSEVHRTKNCIVPCFWL